jgi:hypothetical protein
MRAASGSVIGMVQSVASSNFRGSAGRAHLSCERTLLQATERDQGLRQGCRSCEECRRIKRDAGCGLARSGRSGLAEPRPGMAT